ncbi:MAG: hypothetical protein ACLTSZ_06970 [Lachnospiraceae bacterium]
MSWFSVMIFAMPGRVSAAWEKNTDGTYSWYQNGKLKEKQLDQRYLLCKCKGDSKYRCD